MPPDVLKLLFRRKASHGDVQAIEWLQKHNLEVPKYETDELTFKPVPRDKRRLTKLKRRRFKHKEPRDKVITMRIDKIIFDKIVIGSEALTYGNKTRFICHALRRYFNTTEFKKVLKEKEEKIK